MSTQHLIMRARYKRSVRSPGMLGVLIMREDEIVFAPDDPMPPMELTEGFKQIKSHQYNKEGSGLALLKLTHEQSGDYIFEFDNSSERDVCRDFVGRVLGKLQAMQSSVQDMKVTEKPVVPIHDEQLSAEEMQLRMKLLRENNELQKLHKQCVIGGMLTEAEFWTTRKTNKVTINLTPEIIHQIFTEKPVIHQTFLNFVPSKMTEKDFWTKYCKAQYLQVSEQLLDESQVKGTGDQTKQVITAFSTRKRVDRTKAEDFGAEEWHWLKEEEEQEVFDRMFVS